MLESFDVAIIRATPTIDRIMDDDSVSDVIEVSEDQRCAAPDFEGHKDREFISGLAQIDGKLLILLDVDRMVKPETLDQTETAAPAAAAL